MDPYGFERSEDFDYESYEELMSEYLVVLTRRSIKWSKLLKGKSKVQKNVKRKRERWTQPIQSEFTHLKWVKLKRSPSSPVKRYVRKGVPNEHRAAIWMAASGAQDQLDKNPGYYQSLLGADHDSKLMDTICTGRALIDSSPWSLRPPLKLWHTPNLPQPPWGGGGGGLQKWFKK